MASVLQWIPWLDIFLVLLFLGLTVLGFWQGLLKQLWFLISLYLGAILASLYGDYVGGLIAHSAGAPTSEVSSAWGFFIVMAPATAILFAIIVALTGQLRLRSRLLVLDKVGGIALGVLTSFFITSLIAYVLYAVLSVQGFQEWAFVSVLKAQRETSPLLHLFVSVRPVIQAMVMPWLPEAPRFLRIQ